MNEQFIENYLPIPNSNAGNGLLQNNTGFGQLNSILGNQPNNALNLAGLGTNQLVSEATNGILNSGPSITPPPVQPGLFDGLGDFIGSDSFGNLATALGAGVGAFTGLQNLGLARDTFDIQKDFAQKNLDNSVALAKNQLSNRNANRRAFSGDTIKSISDKQAVDNVGLRT